VRWLSPMAVTLMHHGAGLLLLLDSLRMESMQAPSVRQNSPGGIAAGRAADSAPLPLPFAGSPVPALHDQENEP